MKTLSCRHAGFDCDREVRAESEGEVLKQAAEHAWTGHKVEVTREMAEQIKGLIREETE